MCVLLFGANGRASESFPRSVQQFVDQHCLDCHDGADSEAGLDLSSLSYNLNEPSVFGRWVQINDRIRDGEMPPPETFAKAVMAIGQSLGWADEDARTDSTFEREAKRMLHQLAVDLSKRDKKRVETEGRAKVRRLNRLEYENTLQLLLAAPWLQVAHLLPEDGVADLFNKSGEHLDVSHVQMTQYLSTARYALGLAANAAAHPSQTRKFYAREESSMQNSLHYRFGQRAVDKY